jgi:small subunit ribosomal protein S4
MARYTGPKDRLSRREGYDLFGKGAKLTRLSVPPGVHGPKGAARQPSQYGRQLREKQKVRRIYGVMERQFRKYVNQALKSKGNTGEHLLILLERRLDNVIYRLGFAPTRMMARQLVSHRHVLVNDMKVNIPSYQVKKGDVIMLSTKAQEMPAVKKLLANKDLNIPEWLEKKGAAGKVAKDPKREDIIEPISEQDIVEFYSR